MKGKKDILWRVGLVYFLVCLFGLGILGKVFVIQFVEGDKWKEKAKHMMVDLRTIKAIKGNIYATDQKSILASSDVYYEIRMDMKVEPLTDSIFYNNVDSLAYYLHVTFPDRSQAMFTDRLKKAYKKENRYHMVRSHVKYTELQELKKFPLFRRGQYKGGIIVLKKTRRVRPFRKLAARTVGYDRAENGCVGLECAYSEELTGADGKQWQERIAGNYWKPVTDDYIEKPIDGKDIVTTIDINIQDVAERALEKQLMKHKAHHGSVIVMEVATGYVRAIANLAVTSKEKYYETYNYAIGSSTEPGSTFKLASYMVLLDQNNIQLADTIKTGNGRYKFFDQTMTDSRLGGYGAITVQRAFEVSSNVAISKMVFDTYYASDPTRFTDRLASMGLGEPLGIDIHGEGAPVLKDPRDKANWSGTTLPWMSIGYSVRQTPLQTLTLYNAVANNGKMMKPQFVERILSNGQVIRVNEPIVLREEICKQETIEKLKIMMEGVVERGTATNLRDADFKIAGKTGTAKIAAKGGYGKEYLASFAGYFPAENPIYSCIVVINAPSQDVFYGNVVAGPIFREIADKVYANSLEYHDTQLAKNELNTHLPYAKNGNKEDLLDLYEQLGIPVLDQSREDVEYVRVNTGEDEVNLYSIKIDSLLVPKVKGMCLQDAMYMLEDLGMEVRFVGSGVVVNQSLKAGERFIPGQYIELELL